MPRNGRLFCLLLSIGLAVLGGLAGGGEARAQYSIAPGVPWKTDPEPVSAVMQTWQDDATLHDVQFLGSQSGWAVGDHGTIWHTHDGGTDWQRVSCPVDVPLRQVCFLTDRVGWIVGGEVTPYTRVSRGVVLATRDGGTTWQVHGAGKLPRLHFVKFFDMETGIAAGDSSPRHPSGLFVTDDGGVTWREITGKPSRGWRTGDFLSPEDGAVAGERGHAFLVSRGRLLRPEFAQLRLEGFRSVKMQAEHASWMVGDGATVRVLPADSATWQEPPGWLPEALRHLADFHAVACHGKSVWIAGRPGSAIWHSEDGGRTWRPQRTGQPQPIRSIDFTSETNGCAVGALGTILLTVDGGETWKPVRGAGRRAALMTLHARAEQVSFPLLAREAGELGYRSVSIVPFRRDVGMAADERYDVDVCLHEAVISVGGGMAERGWRLPINLPDIEHDSEQLLAEWNRQTDGRVGDALVGDLVCQIRTWRPSVLILDEPGPDDAAVKLLNEAVLKAVEEAAKPSSFPEQAEYAGLAAWQVGKVYLHLAPGSTGDTHIELHDALPRLGKINHTLAAAALSRLPGERRIPTKREAFRLLKDHTASDETSHSPGGFFAGIPLAAGSSARRELSQYNEQEAIAAQRFARRQRNFDATVHEWLNAPRLASAMIAQLETYLHDIPDDQAAVQLATLADEYRRQARWDLVETTLIELVERYPRHPLAEDAQRWLFQFWSSAEVSWQRSRQTQSGNIRRSAETAELAANRVQQALALSQVNPHEREIDLTAGKTDPLAESRQGAVLALPAANSHLVGHRDIWQQQALSAMRRMREHSPRLAESPEIQFPLAALMRRREVFATADRIYREYLATSTEGAWATAAAAEVWLTQPTNEPPKTPLACRRTDLKPVLDGVLSDACWLDASEIPLTQSEDEVLTNGEFAFAMLAHDGEYLYLAASIPRKPGQREDRPQYEGRTHDADLTHYDRLSFQFDVDRDYATYYELQVDQRGWTRDSCWNDAHWNPKWHVAAEADGTHWRIEAAIPFKELAPEAPASKDVWAVGVTRVIPAVGVQSWTHPASQKPQPANFGLVRFD